MPFARSDSTVASAVAVAAALLVASGCGGSNRPHIAAAPAHQNAAIAFSSCMRSNGVPKFPDPGSGGGIPKVGLEQLGVSAARFQSGEHSCRHLLPNGGSRPTPAEMQQVKAEGLTFARCVRTHGIPNFPDPGTDGRIPDPATVGINQGSPKFEAANQACGADRPPYMPSNAAYNSWARTHG